MSTRQALLSLVNGDLLVDEPRRAGVSRQFVENFELVAIHYRRLHELGNYVRYGLLTGSSRISNAECSLQISAITYFRIGRSSVKAAV